MRKLIVAVTMTLVMLVVLDSDKVFGESPNDKILRKLDKIQKTLDDQVVPKLDECCGKIGVPRTGQTTSYAPGDDGDLQKGIDWPKPRFTDHENGTVTDNLTRLTWTKNANIYGIKPWCQAIISCNSSSEGGYTDWRLPNVRELHSLVDYGGVQYSMLPADHPFTGVGISLTFFYWSSTSYSPDEAWTISFENGHMYPQHRNCSPDDPTGYLVWCVRRGN